MAVLVRELAVFIGLHLISNNIKSFSIYAFVNPHALAYATGFSNSNNKTILVSIFSRYSIEAIIYLTKESHITYLWKTYGLNLNFLK